MRVPTALACLLLAWSADVADAQERHFGAKVGPNFATLTLAEFPDEDYDTRFAIGGGGFAVLPVRGRFAVQLEALFNPKGASLEDEEFGTATLLLNYLDFPVLARFEALRSGAFHVFGGPYLGIRVGATRQSAAEAPGFTVGTRENMGDEVERFQMGLVAGAGIHQGRRLVIDGRYAWGLTNVNSDTSEGVRFRSRVLTFMVGLRF